MQRNVGTVEQIGSIVAGSALLLYGLTRGRTIGALSAITGGALLAHGVSSHSRIYEALGIESTRDDGTDHPLNRVVHVRHAIAVSTPPAEAYAFWRELSNLPRFMEDIVAVEPLDEKRSRWHARGPFDRPLQWEAEIIEERENELIRWRTIEPGSDLQHSGTVAFEPAPAGRGTIVRVDFNWSPPGGVFTAALAKLLPQDPARRVREDLRRFRQLIETGELPSNGLGGLGGLEQAQCGSEPPRRLSEEAGTGI